jgi:hypothetical protein
MLTTTDNPYDPFDDWDSWYEYDTRMGYNSSTLLARMCITSFELSEADEILSITQAIDEIVTENVSGMHKKVTKEYPPPIQRLM